jgi:4-methyl-5(b-hydroxyethyl)-thiazole monophosphate biosynthesis
MLQDSTSISSHKIKKEKMMEKHAIIVLADGFEELEAIAPIDIMRRAGIQVTIIGLTSLSVRGSHDIEVKAATTLNEFSHPFDALVLPGGPGHKHLLDSKKMLEMVRSAFEQHLLCAAICAAPVVLAKAGILGNKKVTCFPGEEGKLDGATFIEQKTVVDGNIITSRGAGTAIEFALEIVAFLAGREKADWVAKKIIY